MGSAYLADNCFRDNVTNLSIRGPTVVIMCITAVKRKMRAGNYVNSPVLEEKLL